MIGLAQAPDESPLPEGGVMAGSVAVGPPPGPRTKRTPLGSTSSRIKGGELESVARDADWPPLQNSEESGARRKLPCDAMTQKRYGRPSFMAWARACAQAPRTVSTAAVMRNVPSMESSVGAEAAASTTKSTTTTSNSKSV